MNEAVSRMLDAARRARVAGTEPQALSAYRAAAAEARRLRQTEGLAHALRHVADIERELGFAETSLASAREAAALYRGMGETHCADLANALRLVALAQQALGTDAAASWREARSLYRQCGITAGADECDLHLAE